MRSLNIRLSNPAITAIAASFLIAQLATPVASAEPNPALQHEIAHEIELYDFTAVSICDPVGMTDARMEKACADFSERITSRLAALPPGASLCLRTIDLKRDRAVWAGLPSEIKDVLDQQEWIILSPASSGSAEKSATPHPDAGLVASCS